MVTRDGVIYGSQSRMYDLFLNLVQVAGCSLPEAVCMTASNAAALYHLNTGSIQVGKAADFLVMDESLRLLEAHAAG